MNSSAGQVDPIVGARAYWMRMPSKSAALATVLFASAAVALVLERRSARPINGLSENAYFTTDDTLTGPDALRALFVDSVSKVPPFDHDGKTGMRAAVYTCDGTRWVNNLLRYKAATVPRVQAAYAAQERAGYKTDPDLGPFEPGLEVKAPGSGNWVRADSDAGIRIIAAHPPPGLNPANVQIEMP